MKNCFVKHVTRIVQVNLGKLVGFLGNCTPRLSGVRRPTFVFIIVVRWWIVVLVIGFVAWLRVDLFRTTKSFNMFRCDKRWITLRPKRNKAFLPILLYSLGLHKNRESHLVLFLTLFLAIWSQIFNSLPPVHNRLHKVPSFCVSVQHKHEI